MCGGPLRCEPRIRRQTNVPQSQCSGAASVDLIVWDRSRGLYAATSILSMRFIRRADAGMAPVQSPRSADMSHTRAAQSPRARIAACERACARDESRCSRFIHALAASTSRSTACVFRVCSWSGPRRRVRPARTWPSMALASSNRPIMAKIWAWRDIASSNTSAGHVRARSTASAAYGSASSMRPTSARDPLINWECATRTSVLWLGTIIVGSPVRISSASHGRPAFLSA
mmetsp:Transcript_6434/g.27081  ORF Transcript_6434/g.27081 Transcript_6434/m.27081 type:complete len:230 (-) Transcript_6434:322-1011(-)